MDDSTNPTPKVVRTIRKLDGFFNPKATEIAQGKRNEQCNSMMDLSEVCVDLGLAATDGLLDNEVKPQSFREAWDHLEPGKWQKWRDAIHKEFTNMNCRGGVWQKIKRSQMPQGRQCIKHKWVLKMKQSGIYRA